MIESDAMYRFATGDQYLLTTIETSPIAISQLAKQFALPEVPEATDQFAQWWASENMGIGCVPYPSQTHYAYVFWLGDDIRLAEKCERSLVDLLPPHARKGSKATTLESAFRDTRQQESTGVANRITPAISFREACRKGLKKMHHDDAVEKAPPSSDADLHDYLLQNIGRFKRDNNCQALYFAASGLLAFGHLEYLDDVLDNLPRDEDWAWGEALWAGKSLRQLVKPWGGMLPCPVQHTEEYRRLFSERRGKLQWNQEKCRYTAV